MESIINSKYIAVITNKLLNKPSDYGLLLGGLLVGVISQIFMRKHTQVIKIS